MPEADCIELSPEEFRDKIDEMDHAAHLLVTVVYQFIECCKLIFLETDHLEEWDRIDLLQMPLPAESADRELNRWRGIGLSVVDNDADSVDVNITDTLTSSWLYADLAFDVFRLQFEPLAEEVIRPVMEHVNGSPGRGCYEALENWAKNVLKTTREAVQFGFDESPRFKTNYSGVLPLHITPDNAFFVAATIVENFIDSGSTEVELSVHNYLHFERIEVEKQLAMAAANEDEDSSSAPLTPVQERHEATPVSTPGATKRFQQWDLTANLIERKLYRDGYDIPVGPLAEKQAWPLLLNILEAGDNGRSGEYLESEFDVASRKALRQAISSLRDKIDLVDLSISEAEDGNPYRIQKLTTRQ